DGAHRHARPRPHRAERPPRHLAGSRAHRRREGRGARAAGAQGRCVRAGRRLMARPPFRDDLRPKNTVSYFWREAVRRIWISKRSSVIAIAMIALSLLIVGAFLLVAENLGRAVANAQGRSRVSVFLDADATPQQTAAAGAWLAAHP